MGKLTGIAGLGHSFSREDFQFVYVERRLTSAEQDLGASPFPENDAKNFLMDLRFVPANSISKFSGSVFRTWKTFLARSHMPRACETPEQLVKLTVTEEDISTKK
nr:hypothetical protein Itr_chr10CG04970 [Ipomoea trifida]